MWNRCRVSELQPQQQQEERCTRCGPAVSTIKFEINKIRRFSKGNLVSFCAVN